MPFEDLTGTIVRKICSSCSREFSGELGVCPHDGNLLMALPQDQWEGRRLADRYSIKQRLGTGGMGVVYLAWHELMERWVAIKMLKQSFVEDQMSVKRFQQEAKAASRLKHPNVITLHDFGVTNTGQPYMVMDYLVGYDKEHEAKSLSQFLKEAGQLPVEKCIHIISQACEALDHAHRQGVIHRDVKPANIMIVPTEEDHLAVKVVDFGVAKLLPINNLSAESQGLTQIGEVCGSPVYMSPEQCMGQALDSRADIYSMGVVLYECITGKLPLIGKNMVETMSKHMNETPPSFSTVRSDLFIPDRFEQVVMRALAKSPHSRQQSMAELAQELQFSIPRPGQTPNLKAHELLPLPEDAPTTGVNWLWPAVGGGLMALAIAGFAFFATQKPAPAPAPHVVPAPVTVTKPVTPVRTPITTPVTTSIPDVVQPPNAVKSPGVVHAAQKTRAVRASRPAASAAKAAKQTRLAPTPNIEAKMQELTDMRSDAAKKARGEW